MANEINEKTDFCEFCDKPTVFVKGAEGRYYCQVCGMYKSEESLPEDPQ